MKIACEWCSQEFAPRRRDARFCGATCRSRAHRQGNGSGDGSRLELLRPPAGDATDDGAGPVEPGPVERAAIAELSAVRRLYNSVSASALVLAARLDRPERETGSQLAALQKQFESTMTAALAQPVDESDPVDELRARAEAKRRAAGEEPA